MMKQYGDQDQWFWIQLATITSNSYLATLRYNFFIHTVATKIEWTLRIVVRIILWIFSHILAND